MQLIFAIGSTYYFNDFKALTYFKFCKNWIGGGVKVLLRDGKLFCFLSIPQKEPPPFSDVTPIRPVVKSMHDKLSYLNVTGRI
jgi:hypothetical protein